MAEKRADAAPGSGMESTVEEERERLERDKPTIPEKEPPMFNPPPAPGLTDHTSAWIEKNVVNAWISRNAEDTRDAVIDQIGRSILERFNSDADMAVGKAVTISWLDNQLATYSFPITVDDVKARTRSIFETNGVEVREG